MSARNVNRLLQRLSPLLTEQDFPLSPPLPNSYLVPAIVDVSDQEQAGAAYHNGIYQNEQPQTVQEHPTHSTHPTHPMQAAE